MSPRGVYERVPRPPMAPKTCDVEGCDKQARTPGGALCGMHYTRTRRPDSSLKRQAREQRTRDMQADYELGMSTTEVGAKHGLDSSHVSRLLREAGTVMRPFGGSGVAHPGWAGDAVTYSGAHMRVKAVRGSAAEHLCAAGCGARAVQWAYTHDDPAELRSPEGPYSPDVNRYVPMCVPCHKRFDLARLK